MNFWTISEFQRKNLFLSLPFSAFLCISLHFFAFFCISLQLSEFLWISLLFSAFLWILHFIFRKSVPSSYGSNFLIAIKIKWNEKWFCAKQFWPVKVKGIIQSGANMCPALLPSRTCLSPALDRHFRNVADYMNWKTTNIYLYIFHFSKILMFLVKFLSN